MKIAAIHRSFARTSALLSVHPAVLRGIHGFRATSTFRVPKPQETQQVTAAGSTSISESCEHNKVQNTISYGMASMQTVKHVNAAADTLSRT